MLQSENIVVLAKALCEVWGGSDVMPVGGLASQYINEVHEKVVRPRGRL